MCEKQQVRKLSTDEQNYPQTIHSPTHSTTRRNTLGKQVYIHNTHRTYCYYQLNFPENLKRNGVCVILAPDSQGSRFLRSRK